MIFVLRKDLKMRIGKIAAQVGHTSLSLWLELAKTQPELAATWAQTDFPKKFFYCPNEDSMNQIDHRAKELGYTTFIIHDLGRTAVAAGSATVLSIAPVPARRVCDVIPAGLRPLP
jgi:PTH2 family peptidyl-tRNA hydrolase